MPVHGFGPFQPAQQGPDDYGDRRYAQEHDQRQERRHRPQHDGDDQIRDDRANTRPGQRQYVRDLPDVGAGHRGDLPGGEPTRENGADPREVTQHNGRRPGGRILPDERHRAVPHDAQPREANTRYDDRGDPQQEGPDIVRAQPIVNSAGDEIRPDRQSDHPSRANQAAPQYPPRLASHQPPDVTQRAPRIWNAWFGMGDPRRHSPTLPIGPEPCDTGTAVSGPCYGRCSALSRQEDV